MANKNNTLNAIDSYIGSRVRLARLTKRMTQEEIGGRLGITFQQFQKYEKGANRISAGRLQHIAEILAVPVSYFFEGSPKIESENIKIEKTNIDDFEKLFNSIKNQESREAILKIMQVIVAAQ
ncbi:MAG: hypothetical protein RLZZ292_1948 [Bacteroidota bacterium]|jgi:transcriptional regulator with XRE-family HTH domain